MTKSKKFFLSCAWLAATAFVAHAQSTGVSFVDESLGPRPLRSFEPIRELATNSPFRKAALPVGGLVIEVFGRQNFVCTATLVSPSLVLTARHCLEQKDRDTDEVIRIEPERATFLLDYISRADPAVTVELNPVPAEEGEGDLDFMLFETLEPIDVANRQIPVAGLNPSSREDLLIIHAPIGLPLQLGRWGCRAFDTPSSGVFIHHRCDTMESSSGAPIMDLELRLVGIHVEGGKSERPDSFNRAISLSAILQNSQMLMRALDEFGGLEIAQDDLASNPRIERQFVIKAFEDSAFEGRIWQADGRWYYDYDAGRVTEELIPQQSGNDSKLVFWRPSTDTYLTLDEKSELLEVSSPNNPIASIVGSVNRL